MATGRPDDRAHHFGVRALGGMRVTAETIEGLYREQALGLLRFALLLTGDLSTAEDLVQEPDPRYLPRSHQVACRPG